MDRTGWHVPGQIEVYSGLNETGSLLAVVPLTITTTNLDAFGNPLYDVWREISIPFSGTAMSVDFGGDLSQFGNDAAY